MSSTEPTTARLSQAQQLDLAQRLAHWRRNPLSTEELATLLPQVSDADLALAIGERLGMAGPEAFPLLADLSQQHGISRPLIRALGICHHPEACKQLLRWLPNAGALEPEVLRALSCWGNQIDLNIISNALSAPGRDHRLAGLALLTFRCRSLPTSKLLALCEPLLDDLRAEVVIATLRLLQRRDEPEVLAAINRCIAANALPEVAETAILALGCINSSASCQLLLEQLQTLQHTPLANSVKRQLRAQRQHHEQIQHTLSAMGVELD